MLLGGLPDSSGTEKTSLNQTTVDLIMNVSSTLKEATNPEGRRRPLFPRDLNTTNNFLDIVSQWVGAHLRYGHYSMAWEYTVN